jgi:hypothetical protein
MFAHQRHPSGGRSRTTRIRKKPQAATPAPRLDCDPEALMKNIRTAAFTKRIRTTGPVFWMALLAAVMAASCSHVAAYPAIDQDVLAAREAAWRAYFSGDVKALGELLPEEFIGLGMNDAPFADRATTLEGARAFHEGGGRLVRLAFPETQAHRFGDVVVLYGRYEAVIQSGGAERTMRGRLTEMFVRRDGKWWHPGWHLDLTAGPAPSEP